jgi:hypothetical protein
MSSTMYDAVYISKILLIKSPRSSQHMLFKFEVMALTQRNNDFRVFFTVASTVMVFSFLNESIT